MTYSQGLGPRGHDLYSDIELATADFSWIEDEAVWSFLYRHVHNDQSGNLGRGRIDTQQSVIWERFRFEMKSRRPIWKLRTHFNNNLAPNLHKAYLCGEAIIRLYYGLGLPVNVDFLNILRSEADVETDMLGKLTYYAQRCVGGLQIGMGKNASQHIALSEHEQMWDFLTVRIHDPETGNVYHPSKMPNDIALWSDFKAEKLSPLGAVTLLKSFRDEVAPNLHKTDYDLPTKAKLCYALRLKVHPELLNQFKTNASIRMDPAGRLLYYKQFNSSLEMGMNVNGGIPKSKKEWKRMPFTEEEENAMYAFVYNKLKNPGTKIVKKDKDILNSNQIWVEFDKQNKIHRDSKTYKRRFQSIMLPALYLANIPKMMKVALHFALEVPVPEEWLKELRKSAIIELNNGCIIAYRERARHIFNGYADDRGNIVDLDDDEPVAKVPKTDQLSRVSSSESENQGSRRIVSAPQVHNIDDENNAELEDEEPTPGVEMHDLSDHERLEPYNEQREDDDDCLPLDLPLPTFEERAAAGQELEEFMENDLEPNDYINVNFDYANENLLVYDEVKPSNNDNEYDPYYEALEPISDKKEENNSFSAIEIGIYEEKQSVEPVGGATNPVDEEKKEDLVTQQTEESKEKLVESAEEHDKQTENSTSSSQKNDGDIVDINVEEPVAEEHNEGDEHRTIESAGHNIESSETEKMNVPTQQKIPIEQHTKGSEHQFSESINVISKSSGKEEMGSIIEENEDNEKQVIEQIFISSEFDGQAAVVNVQEKHDEKNEKQVAAFIQVSSEDDNEVPFSSQIETFVPVVHNSIEPHVFEMASIAQESAIHNAIREEEEMNMLDIHDILTELIIKIENQQ